MNAGDLDGDGYPDLVVANFEAEPNSFYRNVGEGIFEDASANSGFGAPAFNFSGFGLNLLDAANAGWLDAYIANGHVLEVPKMQGVTYAERPFFMWNDGKAKFVERGCGEPFRKAIVGRGSAVANRQRRRRRHRRRKLRGGAPASAQRRKHAMGRFSS